MSRVRVTTGLSYLPRKQQRKTSIHTYRTRPMFRVIVSHVTQDTTPYLDRLSKLLHSNKSVSSTKGVVRNISPIAVRKRVVLLCCNRTGCGDIELSKAVLGVCFLVSPIYIRDSPADERDKKEPTRNGLDGRDAWATMALHIRVQIIYRQTTTTNPTTKQCMHVDDTHGFNAGEPALPFLA